MKCQKSEFNKGQVQISAPVSLHSQRLQPAKKKKEKKNVTSNENKNNFSDYSMSETVVCNSQQIE